MSKDDQLRQDYNLQYQFHNDSDKYNLNIDPTAQLQKSNPTAVLAYKYITEEQMEQLEYNLPRVKEAITIAENTSKTVKLIKNGKSKVRIT